MKRLKLLILVFCLAVSLPLAFVVWQTYQSLSQEEYAQLRFFSEALFDEMEKEHIRRTIDHCHGNLTQAAELLGITRQTLYNKMKRL